jgi:hypothetical protein
MNIRNVADQVLDEAFNKYLLAVFERYFTRMDRGSSPLLDDLKRAQAAYDDAAKLLDSL